MSAARIEVAITGLGIISSIGLSTAEVADSLRQGRSGVVVDPVRKEMGFRSALTGTIKGFDPARYGCSAKMLRTMAEPAMFAWAAAGDAIADAGLGPDDLENPRTGLIFGNDSCIAPSIEAFNILSEEGETHFIGGGNVFKVMNSTVSMNLASALKIAGANWTLSAACASGSHAIGQAAVLIRAGLQDVVLAGGAQETGWPSMMSFDSLAAFSLRENEPECASRPFDAERDGLVPSGGAACVILENAAKARSRGARIHGIVAGYGFSSNSSRHLSRPSAGGAGRAMEMALADAGASADEVDYINAHATSTPIGDRIEAEAIFALFGDKTPVSSTKSLTGHECWMAGASEALYTIIMARGGFVAGNANFTRQEAEAPRINVVPAARDCRIRRALSNSFGFGGTNAVLVFDFDGQN